MSEEWEEQRCNYERYRFLVLNQFKRVSEQEALAAIEVEEMFHVPGKPSGSSGSRDKSKSVSCTCIIFDACNIYGTHVKSIAGTRKILVMV